MGSHSLSGEFYQSTVYAMEAVRNFYPYIYIYHNEDHRSDCQEDSVSKIDD